jgi:hypothetical protein
MAATILTRLPYQPTPGSKGSKNQIKTTAAKNDFDWGDEKWQWWQRWAMKMAII